MIYQIAGICLCAAVLIVLLGQHRPELALLLSVGAGVVVFLFLLPQITAVLETVKAFVADSGISLAYFEPVVKITAVAYVAQFAAEICIDAGQKALGSKVEIAGKILIASMAVPILTGLFGAIGELL